MLERWDPRHPQRYKRPRPAQAMPRTRALSSQHSTRTLPACLPACLLAALPDTPYEHGWYHGMLRFPTNYPMKPPAVLMLTPSGRFEVNQRLCLSISDFHPETWNPIWSASSIIMGLISFMTTDESTAGSKCEPLSERRRLARASMETNMSHRLFPVLFPDIAEQARAAGGQGAPSADDSAAAGVRQRAAAEQHGASPAAAASGGADPAARSVQQSATSRFHVPLAGLVVPVLLVACAWWAVALSGDAAWDA